METQPDRQSERPDNAAPGKQIDALNLLDLQIRAHRRHDKNESWLSYGIAKVTTLAGRGNDSLKQLEDLKEKAQKELKAGDMQAFAQTENEIRAQVKADRESLGWRDNVTHYSGSILKTGCLFLKGRLALAGTVGLYGVDNMHSGDSWQAQVADFGLGGAKGGATRYVLGKIGDAPLSAGTKGATLGLLNTAVELGLTRKTYQDKNTGELSGNAAVGNILTSALDWKARLVDAGTFLAAHGISSAGNKLTGGAIDRSPLWKTIATGGSFGLSGGAASEVVRQREAHEKFDLSKVLSSAFLQAGADSIASIPGGLQARSMVRRAAMPAETTVESLLAKEKPLSTRLPLEGITEVEEARTKPMSTRARVEALSIKAPAEAPISELVKRITGYTVVTEQHPVPVPGEKNFKNFEDFWERGLKMTDRKMRIYDIEGTHVKLAVPEEHAPKLEEVRDLQIRVEQERNPALVRELSKHPFFNTWRPEHIVALMSEVPDLSVVRRITLCYCGETSYTTEWLRESYKKDFKSSGFATREGEIRMFSTDRGNLEKFRRTFFHEWSHLVKFALGEQSHLFNLAAVLEEHGYSRRDYSRKNTEENWADHMEKALRTDSYEIMELADEAPIRTAIFGRALKQLLDKVPAEQRSVHHQRYLERVKFIENEVLPKALEQLWEMRNSSNQRYQQIALRLLGTLGGENELAYFKHIGTSLNTYTATRNFHTAGEIGARHPEQWLDTLVFASRNGSSQKHLATDRLAKLLAAGELPESVGQKLEADALRLVRLKAAEIQMSRGILRTGRENCEAALASAEKDGFVNFNDYRETFRRVNRIARAYAERGKAERAQSLVDRLIDVQYVGEDHPHNAITLKTLGDLQLLQKRTIHAVASYELALQINQKNYGNYHPVSEGIRSSLAAVHLEGGNLAEARALYKFIVDDIPAANSEAQLRRARLIEDAANRFMKFGDFVFAEQLFKKALEGMGDHTTNQAADLNNLLADNLWKQEKFEEAIYRYWDELQIRERLPNQDAEYVQQLRDWIDRHTVPAAQAS